MGKGAATIPLQKGEEWQRKALFSFMLNFCVRVSEYSMTLHTNEKIVLYLLTFTDKIK